MKDEKIVWILGGKPYVPNNLQGTLATAGTLFRVFPVATRLFFLCYLSRDLAKISGCCCHWLASGELNQRAMNICVRLHFPRWKCVAA
jgi:hypothetical protein